MCYAYNASLIFCYVIQWHLYISECNFHVHQQMADECNFQKHILGPPPLMKGQHWFQGNSEGKYKHRSSLTGWTKLGVWFVTLSNDLMIMSNSPMS